MRTKAYTLSVNSPRSTSAPFHPNHAGNGSVPSCRRFQSRKTMPKPAGCSRVSGIEGSFATQMETRSLTAQEKDAMLYARTGKVEQLKELLAQSGIPASLTAPNASFSLLTLAAKHGHLEMIHWLLKEGADPNWVGYNGCALDEAGRCPDPRACLARSVGWPGP